MLKRKWCRAMMLPLSSSVAHQKAVCQSVREATTASGVDNAASPDWQTPLNGIISPLREEARSLCKNNWKEPRSDINEQGCRVALLSMGNSCNYCERHNIAAASSGVMLMNKTEQSIYECLLGFCFNNIFAPPQIAFRPTVFFCPIPERRNDGWWFLGATAAGLFWTVNVCRAMNRNKQGQRSSDSIFFMVLFPMLFEVRRIVCVEKIKQTLNNELKFHIVNIY